jgi:hypothetical protein
MIETPNHPIWWTLIDRATFKRGVPPRSLLLGRSHKCQTWFEARQKLGGDPRPLSEVAPDAARIERKMERNHV